MFKTASDVLKCKKPLFKGGETILDETGAVCRQIDAEMIKTDQKRAYKLENGVENVTNMKNGVETCTKRPLPCLGLKIRSKIMKTAEKRAYKLETA